MHSVHPMFSWACMSLPHAFTNQRTDVCCLLLSVCYTNCTACGRDAVMPRTAQRPAHLQGMGHLPGPLHASSNSSTPSAGLRSHIQAAPGVVQQWGAQQRPVPRLQRSTPGRPRVKGSNKQPAAAKTQPPQQQQQPPSARHHGCRCQQQ